MGYWPILPFAGLELLALGVGLRISMRRGGYHDRIEVGSDDVIVSKSRGSRVVRRRFRRPWASVRLVNGTTRHAASALEIGSRGRWCVVGEFLTDEERYGLGQRLSVVLGRTNK